MKIETVGDVERVRYRRNPLQRRIKFALETEKKIVGVFASWRSGKTDYVALEHCIRRQAYDNGGVLHLIAANTYGQLIDSTLRALYDKLELMGIPHVPRNLPKSHRPFNVFVWNGDRWVEFACRSMDNFDMVAGMTFGSIWLDEVWKTEKWTYELAISRLSDKRSRHLQMVLTTTKDEPEHWMYTDIVQLLDLGRIMEGGVKASEVIELVEGTTYENEWNLAPGFIRTLRATLDPKMFSRYVENKWVSAAAGQMFYEFDRAIHMKTLPVEEYLPLIVSSDFNIDPMCWSIWQMPKGERLNCVDQLKMDFDADTETATKEILNRYPRVRHFVWTGDASGRARSTKSKSSDYQIIRATVEAAGRTIELRVRQSNPSVRDSANAVNGMLKNAEGKARMFFDRTKVPDAILSVEGAKYKPGTLEKDDSADRDPSSRVKTHFADTVRYVADAFFPARPRPIGRQFTK